MSLFNLLVDGNEKQFRLIFGKIARHRDKAIALGNAEADKTPATDASEADKEVFAMRQANAAVMLLRLNAAEKVWPLLKHSPDPRVRSYIIHWLRPLGGDPKSFIARYEIETDVTTKRALLLCLGEFDRSRLPESERKRLIDVLLTVYRSDPDAGLHAAAEWLLRKWRHDEKIAAIDKELKQRDEQLTSHNNTRQWYVNSQGQTFVILDAGEFLMGSPESEARRNLNEQLHKQKIGRRIAISTKEVTKGQWRVFEKPMKGIVWAADSNQLKRYIRTDDSPMVAMTWFEAAWYCNWLSDQEGIPKDQWCYEPNNKGHYGPGMKAKQNFWKLTGYRLPTEAEWEFACRARVYTSRYYGATETLLTSYAWYHDNGANQTWPVASLKPNDFGLFGMQGNVFEWVYDSYSSHYPSASKDAAADAPSTNAIFGSSRRVLRGASYGSVASEVRSALRHAYVPTITSSYVGFRPVRTYPATP